jgi:hypothetical protein
MRLTENKGGISYDKVIDRLYCKEMNIRLSIYYIWDKQGISTLNLINSNFLIANIYDEINRE